MDDDSIDSFIRHSSFGRIVPYCSVPYLYSTEQHFFEKFEHYVLWHTHKFLKIVGFSARFYDFRMIRSNRLVVPPQIRSNHETAVSSGLARGIF